MSAINQIIQSETRLIVMHTPTRDNISCNLAQTPNEFVDSVNKRSYSGSPSVTSLFPRTLSTGEPDKLPIGICGDKIRPRTLNPLLEETPSSYWPFKRVLASRGVDTTHPKA
jgi:hypothetical protein